MHCELNIGFCYSALSHYYRSKIIHWTVCNIKETEQITWLRIRSAIQIHWMNQQYWIWCLLYLSVLSTRRCKWINHKVCDLVWIFEKNSPELASKSTLYGYVMLMQGTIALRLRPHQSLHNYDSYLFGKAKWSRCASQGSFFDILNNFAGIGV